MFFRCNTPANSRYANQLMLIARLNVKACWIQDNIAEAKSSLTEYAAEINKKKLVLCNLQQEQQIQKENLTRLDSILAKNKTSLQQEQQKLATANNKLAQTRQQLQNKSLQSRRMTLLSNERVLVRRVIFCKANITMLNEGMADARLAQDKCNARLAVVTQDYESVTNDIAALQVLDQQIQSRYQQNQAKLDMLAQQVKQLQLQCLAYNPYTKFFYDDSQQLSSTTSTDSEQISTDVSTDSATI